MKDGTVMIYDDLQVKLVRLVGMMLIVFIQEKHKDHVYDVVDDMVGTGILGMLVC